MFSKTNYSTVYIGQFPWNILRKSKRCGESQLWSLKTLASNVASFISHYLSTLDKPFYLLGV